MRYLAINYTTNETFEGDYLEAKIKIRDSKGHWELKRMSCTDCEGDFINRETLHCSVCGKEVK